ncbi:MAG: HAMP domain-containing sensor histidine kinase, partial [Planctomycetota bacterium]
LDSQVGTDIAMLHDSSATPLEPHVYDRFDLIERSAFVGKATRKKSAQLEYRLVPHEMPVEKVAEKLPARPLIEHVKNLIPDDLEAQSSAQFLMTNRAYANSPPDQTYRQRQVQSNVQQSVQNQMQQEVGQVQTSAFLVSPFWWNEELVLVRKMPATASMEGIWLNWKTLRATLLEKVADLGVDFDLIPVNLDSELDPARAMAALPVEIVARPPAMAAGAWSPTHTALAIAWVALLTAAALAALALQYLINLNERRSMFVSAVTHELRTPLTTFRLYSDLLARGTVSDPEDQAHYLKTLQVESDRLNHLIDNVLTYARLEKSAPLQRQEIKLSDWIERVTPRFSQRLESAGLTLQVTMNDDCQLVTDPTALEQIVFNLIDNAAKYGKSRKTPVVELTTRKDADQLCISVIDHGAGVDPSIQKTLFQAFTKSAQQAADSASGVGLGLALAHRAARALGGTLKHEATDGGGATFILSLPLGVAK